MKVTQALRDEQINIFAMTYGGVGTIYTHQFLLCKKTQFPKSGKNNLFLLDSKRSLPQYKLSDIGRKYLSSISDRVFELKYIALVDCNIKVRISIELFNVLYDKGYFSVWNPKAPLQYFDGKEEGYLLICKVYKCNNSVEDRLIKRGRKGRNFYYNLEQPISLEVIEQIIPEQKFQEMKQEIIKTLKINDSLIEVINYSCEAPIVPKYSLEIIQQKERQIYDNRNISLDEIADRINKKEIYPKQISVSSNQYYRDPDVKNYVRKRAKGICECCHKKAPFIKENGEPYLETHHLIPLAEGGGDRIDNVCAVCPNCHRKLHFGTGRDKIREKIINFFKSSTK